MLSSYPKAQRRNRVRLNRQMLWAAAMLSLASSATAANLSWTGASGGTWSNAANWSTTTAPTNADDLFILGPGNQAGSLSIDLAASASINSLTFTDPSPVTLTNQSSALEQYLTLGAGGLTTGGGAVTIGDVISAQRINLALGASQTWVVGSGGLTVPGVVSGSGFGLTKMGPGTLTLSSAATNTFNGGLGLRAGTLTLDFANLSTPTNLVSSANALTLNGGTFSVLGKNATGATSAQTFTGTLLGSGLTPFVLNKGSSATNLTLNLGAVTRQVGNTVFFQTNTAWTAGSSSSLAGAAPTNEIVNITSLTGPNGAVTMPASGSYIYMGANAFWGTGTSTRYVAVRGAASAPYQLSGGPLSTAFVLTGGTASTVYSTGATTALTLSGAVNNYALVVNNTAACTIALGANKYTLNGILGIQTALLTISSASTGTVGIGAENELVFNLTTTSGVTISAPIVDKAANNSNLTMSSSSTGSVTLSGANTYSGITTLNGGTLAIATDGANGAASSPLGAVPAAATPGKLVFNGGRLSITPTAAMSLASNRGIQLNGAGGVITNTAAFSVSLTSIITGDGALTLNATNSTGAFIFGAASTFTGGATLSGSGDVIVTNNAAFGSVGTLTLNGAKLRSTTGATTTLANPVVLAANTTFPNIASEKSVIFTGNAVLSGGTRTLTGSTGTSVAGTWTEFAGNLGEASAGLGLIKAGTGTIVLSGASTYTGPTTVSAGRLLITKAAGLYNGQTNFWNDTNLSVASGATLALGVGQDGTSFTSAHLDALLSLGSATTGFQSGSFVGLDSTAGDFTYSGTIADTNAGLNVLGVIKLGSNRLALAGANTYTGWTLLGGGTLVAQHPAAFGPAGKIIAYVVNSAGGTSGAASSGNLEFATDSTVNAYILSGTSSFATSLTLNRLTDGAAFTQVMSELRLGNNTFTFNKGAKVTSGVPSVSFTLVNLSGGAAGTSTVVPTDVTIAILGPVNIGSNNAAKALALDGNTVGNTISGDVTDGLNVLSLIKSGTSTWALSGNNSYTGATSVNAGTLVLGGTNVGVGATAIVGGTLQAGADGALNPNSALTLTDAATAILDLNGTVNAIGSLAGGGALGGNVTLGAGTLTVGGLNTSTTYAGSISGPGGMVKVGAGTLTLSGNHTHAGPTQVSGGMLEVNGTLANSAVTVNADATLLGVGSVMAATINSGGILSPATAVTAGTLSMGTLLLKDGARLSFECGPTADLVAVTNPNGLTIEGGAISLFAAGGLVPLSSNGTYTLFTYATAFNGASNKLSILNSVAGKTYSLNDTGSALQVVVGTATTSDWNGALGDNLWSSGGAGGNWKDAAAPNGLGAVINFGLDALTPTTVALGGPRTVGAVSFDNANGFTLGANADMLTLDNGIAAAGLAVTSGSHVINAPVRLNGPVNLAPAAGTSLTVNGVVSGLGKSLSLVGAGTATLTAANTYSGGTVLAAGLLNLGHDGGLGSGTITFAGGSLDAVAGARTLTGNNPIQVAGDFAFVGTNSLNFGTGTVTIPSAKTLTVTAGILTMGGAITGAGFVKAGNGTLTLLGNNTFAGSLTLAASGGTVILSGNNGGRPANANGLTVIGNGAKLQLQANVSNTTAGVSTVLSAETSGNVKPLSLTDGGTLQLRSDTSVTFAGTNNLGGLGAANVTIDLGKLSAAGVGRTLVLAPAGFAVSGATLNVTSADDYTLSLPAISGAGANTNTLNPTTASLLIGNYSGTAATTLVLGGTHTANRVTGIISNGGGTTTVHKTGPGTWELQGLNTYTGVTAVREGTLVLAGARVGTALSGQINVSDTAGLSATLNIVDGTYSIATAINVGNAPTTAATGTVNQTGGAIVFTSTSGNQVLVGQGTVGNVGVYNLSGGSITTIASATRGVMMGVNGGGTSTAIFNLSGTGALNMNVAGGANGNAILQVGRSDTVANNCNATFNQTGGTANIGILTIGGGASSGSTGLVSTLNLTGGYFWANSFTLLAAGATNTATINIGGTALVHLPAFPTVRGAGSTATLNFDGGTLRPTVSSTAYLSGLTNAFIKAGGARFETNANDITIAQRLLTDANSLGGGLTKDGFGTLTLTGNNTFTGRVNVNGGVLAINGDTALGAVPAAITADQIVLAGGTLRATTDTVLSANRGITLAVNAVGMLSTATGSTFAINGKITNGAGSGTVNLSLGSANSGTIVLNGANDYTGTTDLFGGTTVMGTVAALGTSSVNVWTGANLDLNHLNPTGLPITLAGGGLLKTTTYTGAVTFLATSLDAAALSLAGPATKVRILAGQTVDLTGEARPVEFTGGTLNGLAAFVGNLIVKTTLDAAAGSISGGAVTLEGGTINLQGLVSTKALNYASGQLLNAANYTGTVDLLGTVTLTPGTLGNGVLQVGTGDAVILTDDGLSNALVVSGGSLDFNGKSATSTVSYVNGTMLNAASLTGDVTLAYVGTKAFAAGSLGAGRVIVPTGATLDFGAGFNNAVRNTGGAVNNGANYSGTMTYAGGQSVAVSTDQVAKLFYETGTTAKGSGTLTSLGFGAGAAYTSTMKDAGGVAGVGYDSVVVSGVLNLASLSAANRLTVNLVSLDGGNVAGGNLANQTFAWNSPKHFTLFKYGTLTLGNGVTNVADLFTVNYANFKDAYGVTAEADWFTVSNDSANGAIVLTAIPEPSTYGLGLAGLALAFAAIRRRQRKTGAAK
jgi:autotransporter-associated beta strand protein